MAGQAAMPSFAAIRTSLLRTPMIICAARSGFVVRSGLIAVHESPRSVDLNTLLPATISTFGSLMDHCSGVSQWKR